MSLVLAADAWGTIGHNGGLPWPPIPGDMVHFKVLTYGHAVIMGRRTLESLPGGKPLPGRHNVVLTRDPAWTPPRRVRVAHSTGEAIAAVTDAPRSYVIGGAAIFEQFVAMVDTIYLTVVAGRYDGDTRVNLDNLLHGFTPEIVVVQLPPVDEAPAARIMCLRRDEWPVTT